MTRIRRALNLGATLSATALVLTLGAAPLLVNAADHLDAPSLGHLSVDGSDNLSIAKLNGPLDINDVYVFKSATAGFTVLAMTVNPAINVLGPTNYASNGSYTFNVDMNGDARADSRYVITFGDPDARGIQHYTVKANGKAVASGFTGVKGTSQSRDGVRAFAGPRSDPFFFDLIGFLGSVKGQGTRRLDDGKQSDFFVGLNTLGIVLEVPNAALGGNGHAIGVWATTSWVDANGVSHRADQMGRPAINTVFNPVADKDAFNQSEPATQRTAMGGKFRNNMIAALEALSALSGTPYTAAQAGGIADLLLPDVLTYTVGSTAAGPLNGRGLADDVIDVELNLVTKGAVPTDMIGAHGDYLASFPYLGNPHP
ncbi:MAG: DUF4331 domain-containing protein [Chloroflexota bacterium]|nr:DUF4331 domain-containing protein [Chloroflexota bacterium]